MNANNALGFVHLPAKDTHFRSLFVGSFVFVHTNNVTVPSIATFITDAKLDIYTESSL